MQVTKVGNQPNFQASFIQNNVIMDFCKNEINKGKDEQLLKALDDLSQHHKNVVLKLSESDSIQERYRIKNLYNGNTAIFNYIQDLKDLSDIDTPIYKLLFVGKKTINPSKTKEIANFIAQKYLVKSAPDYTIGHQVNKSV